MGITIQRRILDTRGHPEDGAVAEAEDIGRLRVEGPPVMDLRIHYELCFLRVPQKAFRLAADQRGVIGISTDADDDTLLVPCVRHRERRVAQPEPWTGVERRA